MNDDVLQDCSRRYGPVLDELQDLIEATIGPLLWKERADTALTDDELAVRVGPIFGSGVALAVIDAPPLVRRINQLLRNNGFEEVPGFDVKEWAEWRIESPHGDGALLTLHLAGYAKAYVTVRA
ncbi:hypothetical protein GCM10028820_05790 [Tessaracoccus terricola]